MSKNYWKGTKDECKDLSKGLNKQSKRDYLSDLLNSPPPLSKKRSKHSKREHEKHSSPMDLIQGLTGRPKSKRKKHKEKSIKHLNNSNNIQLIGRKHSVVKSKGKKKLRLLNQSTANKEKGAIDKEDNPNERKGKEVIDDPHHSFAKKPNKKKRIIHQSLEREKSAIHEDEGISNEKKGKSRIKRLIDDPHHNSALAIRRKEKIKSRKDSHHRKSKHRNDHSPYSNDREEVESKHLSIDRHKERRDRSSRSGSHSHLKPNESKAESRMHLENERAFWKRELRNESPPHSTVHKSHNPDEVEEEHQHSRRIDNKDKRCIKTYKRIILKKIKAIERNQHSLQADINQLLPSLTLKHLITKYSEEEQEVKPNMMANKANALLNFKHVMKKKLHLIGRDQSDVFESLNQAPH